MTTTTFNLRIVCEELPIPIDYTIFSVEVEDEYLDWAEKILSVIGNLTTSGFEDLLKWTQVSTILEMLESLGILKNSE
jgi:hypothetical protein